MKTVIDVITATTVYFGKNQIESPRLNIEHLLAHVLGMKRMDLYLQFDRPLGENELAPLRELVKRRVNGEPLQYLLGTAEFLGKELLCDARALIPRPETEQMCEILIADGRRESCPWRCGHIVDVGVGSGCIAIALAAAFPDARVTAIDISDTALALASENAVRIGVAERIRFLQSDLVLDVEEPIQLIVANLPYIPRGELATLAPEVLREPRVALDGGVDGLAVVRRLISQARLKLNGCLSLELHVGQAAILAVELEEQGFHGTRIVKDYLGRERFLITYYG